MRDACMCVWKYISHQSQKPLYPTWIFWILKFFFSPQWKLQIHAFSSHKNCFSSATPQKNPKVTWKFHYYKTDNSLRLFTTSVCLCVIEKKKKKEEEWSLELVQLVWLQRPKCLDSSPLSIIFLTKRSVNPI